MYCINDTQIEFILNDIRARGVKMDSLQQDILDHVCCIIEQNLEENGDFEGFYSTSIKAFYKKELSEIEDETISLLNNKHFYAMKKVMINSGMVSAMLFLIGIVLKFLHMPGAAICIVLGIAGLCFVFLPLMFTLKIKEKQNVKDKLVIGLGVLSGILITLSVLFKMQYWPGANVMGVLGIGILLLLFLPIYFVSGVKQPETKVNTIVTSVFIVSGCCLILSLVVSPSGMKAQGVSDTRTYLRNEEILKNEQRLVANQIKSDSSTAATIELSGKLMAACEDVKAWMIEYETGYKSIDTDFVSKDIRIGNSFCNFTDNGVLPKIRALEKVVEEYNSTNSTLSNPDLLAIPVKSTFLDKAANRTMESLTDIFRIQMIVLQNEIALSCNKRANT